MRQSTLLVSLAWIASCIGPSSSTVAVLPPERSASSATSEPRSSNAAASSAARAATTASEPAANAVAPSKSEPAKSDVAAQSATATSTDNSAAQAQVVGPTAPAGENVAASSQQRAPRTFGVSVFDREAKARADFAALTPDEQREFIDWFANDAKDFGTFANVLMKYVLDSEPTDRGLWPELEALAPYDTKKHAEAQIIERHPLKPDAPAALDAQEQILGAIPARRLRSGWVYDYVSREPRRLANERDPKREFDNALLGLPPGWDYVEVLVERALDDGSEQKLATAFAHPYTDRVGAVYPGITLYDANASNTAIEMPDVDSLGIIHDVLNDWTTWKAMVPAEQQDSLYAKIHELFLELQHFRGLRHNLARAFICGTTELRDDYQANLDRFHSLWEQTRSMPSELATRLPNAKDWLAFLTKLVDEYGKDEATALKAMQRRLVLDDAARFTHDRLLAYLDQYLKEHRAKK